MLPSIATKLKPIADQIVERYNVKLRPLDKSRFKEDVKLFLSLYNRSLANTWGFVPMSEDELSHMADGLKYLIVPEMTVAAEIDGQVVGVAFGLPDYNPRIKQIDGRLLPFGFVQLLGNKKAIKKIRLISTNVIPEYQRYGVGLVLMQGLVPRAMEWGLQEAEFSWVLESNSLSFGSLKKGGAKITKTYRLYDWEGRRRKVKRALRRTKSGRKKRKRYRKLGSVNPMDRWKFAKSAWQADLNRVHPSAVGDLQGRSALDSAFDYDVKEFLNPPKASVLSCTVRPRNSSRCATDGR